MASPARGWTFSKVGQTSSTCFSGSRPTARYRQQHFLHQEKSRVARPVQQTVPAEVAGMMPSDGVCQSGRSADLPGTWRISTRTVSVGMRSPARHPAKLSQEMQPSWQGSSAPSSRKRWEDAVPQPGGCQAGRATHCELRRAKGHSFSSSILLLQLWSRAAGSEVLQEMAVHSA